MLQTKKGGESYRQELSNQIHTTILHDELSLSQQNPQELWTAVKDSIHHAASKTLMPAPLPLTPRRAQAQTQFDKAKKKN